MNERDRVRNEAIGAGLIVLVSLLSACTRPSFTSTELQERQAQTAATLVAANQQNADALATVASAEATISASEANEVPETPTKTPESVQDIMAEISPRIITPQEQAWDGGLEIEVKNFVRGGCISTHIGESVYTPSIGVDPLWSEDVDKKKEITIFGYANWNKMGIDKTQQIFCDQIKQGPVIVTVVLREGNPFEFTCAEPVEVDGIPVHATTTLSGGDPQTSFCGGSLGTK